MFTLVIGGAASGKSEYAESRVVRLPERRIYLATMRPWDQECRARIARHRRLRQDKGFETLERYTDLAGAEVPAGANVLLECMSNLTANELYDPEGGGEEAVSYVLNTSSRKFHLPACSGAASISEANRQEYAGSRADLVAQDYSPCGTCKP